MNTQEIVAQLNEEIARLTKARDMIIGKEPSALPVKNPSSTIHEKLISLLKDGPARRSDLCCRLDINSYELASMLDINPSVQQYGRGWVKLRDHDNDSERRQREGEG